MLYKLIDGELASITETKMEFQNNAWIEVPRTDEELSGYKALQVVISARPNIYENETITYTDEGNFIQQTYGVADKTSEQIIEINQAFWADNYVQILSLMPEPLYAAKISYKDGESFHLYKETWNSLLSGIRAGFVTYTDIELYSQPDFSQRFTLEYLHTLRRYIQTEAEMGAFMGFLGQEVFTGREVISVI